MPANTMWTGGQIKIKNNFSNCLSLHKAEPLRCLALRTRGGKLKRSFVHGNSPKWLIVSRIHAIIKQPRAISYSRYLQLLHKVVGVNSRIPGVHAAASGSLTLLGSGLDLL